MRSVEDVLITSMAFEDTKEVIIAGVEEEVVVIVRVEKDGVVVVVAEGRVAGLASGIVVGFAALHVVFLSTSSYNSSLSGESEQLEDLAMSHTVDLLMSLLVASV